MHLSLTIIIPVYNEEKNLHSVIPEVMKRAREESWEVIIVDDCSTDRSNQILLEFKTEFEYTVIRNKRNKGYGGAIKEGIKYAETDMLITIDADGQHNIDDINRLLDYAKKEDADMVVGRRNGNSGSLYRSFGKYIIRLLSKILLSIPVKDINSGMKLYNTELAKKYSKLCPDTMAYSDSITFCFYIQKHLVLEHPISIKKRMDGRSTITIKTAFQTVVEIFNIVMLFNPLNLFLPIAVFCILFGLVWGIPIILKGNGVSTGSMLAIITGFLSIFLGLIAEQLSKLRDRKSVV